MISPPAANWIFDAANYFLIAGAVFGLIATALIFWSGAIKERFIEERIKSAEAVADIAKADAAKANEETAKAQLELAKIDPINREIRVFSVDIAIATTARLPTPPAVQLDIVKGDQYVSLICNNIETGFAGTLGTRVKMSFIWSNRNDLPLPWKGPRPKMSWLFYENITPAKLNAEGYHLALTIQEVRRNQITPGECVVEINNSFRQECTLHSGSGYDSTNYLYSRGTRQTLGFLINELADLA
jgi:hypothetical protein